MKLKYKITTERLRFIFDFSKRTKWQEYMNELQINFDLTSEQIYYWAKEIQGSKATRIEEVEPSDLFILCEEMLRLKEADTDPEWLD